MVNIINNLFSLKGKTIILVGSTGYLGTSIAKAISDAEGEMILVGRSAKRLKSQIDALPNSKKLTCHLFELDITDDNAEIRLRQFLEENFGKLHGIVNNAYSGVVGNLHSITEAHFDTAYKYNITKPFLIFKEMMPLLARTAAEDETSVSIVNVASMYGVVSPDPSIYGESGKNNPIHYGASKAGMIQMSRYLACHAGRDNIRVNSVSPGAFPNRDVDSGINKFIESLEAKVPMQRVGRQDEIGGPIVFLLSEASSYISGANIPIDGGWTAW